MTYDSQELLGLFGRLFQQRTFASAAIQSDRRRDDTTNRGQLRLLRLLAANDGLTNAEIAEKLDIRPSSVSALVKKLEAAEFITRTESPEDKRVNQIHLTETGKHFLKESRDFKDEFSQACFQSLTTDEQAQLRDLLRKLVAGLENEFQGPHTEPQWQDFLRQAQHFHGFDRFQGRGFNPFDQHR